MEKLTFSKPDVETVPTILFIKDKADDIATAIRAQSRIESLKADLAKVRQAPKKIAEGIEIIEAEAKKTQTEVESWVQSLVFAASRGSILPFRRIEDLGRILLALVADRIRPLGELLVEPDDTMSKTAREKEITAISKKIETAHAKIKKLIPDEFDFGRIIAIVNGWRDKQALCSSAVDLFGTQLSSENPFFSAYSSLGIGSAIPSNGRYEQNLWLNVNYFYEPFMS